MYSLFESQWTTNGNGSKGAQPSIYVTPLPFHSIPIKRILHSISIGSILNIKILQDPNCIQKATTFACLSWDVVSKNPDLYYSLMSAIQVMTWKVDSKCLLFRWFRYLGVRYSVLFVCSGLNVGLLRQTRGSAVDAILVTWPTKAGHVTFFCTSSAHRCLIEVDCFWWKLINSWSVGNAYQKIGSLPLSNLLK